MGKGYNKGKEGSIPMDGNAKGDDKAHVKLDMDESNPEIENP